jgi:hemoglobin-like flavoprotein
VPWRSAFSGSRSEGKPKQDIAMVQPDSITERPSFVTLRETAILRDTWARVAQNTSAAELFYAKLFELDPELREHFPRDMRAQRQKLTATLEHVVSCLDRFDVLVEEVRALGRRHRDYGATAIDYSTVGDALLWTLEQGLGDAWTSEAERAWEKTFTLLSQTMVRAAEEEV